MLYLQRNVGEIINIDDDIEIFIKSIDGGVVTLGIEAPKERQVWRNEIYVAKKLRLPINGHKTFKKMMVQRYGRAIKRVDTNPPTITKEEGVD